MTSELSFSLQYLPSMAVEMVLSFAEKLDRWCF